jgi:single-strand DNA-binding protein
MGNKFFGEGNLGSDPELNVLDNNSDDKTVCNMRVYFDRNLPKPDGDGFDEKGGFWMDVEIWGKRAIGCDTTLKKGNRVAVDGSIISKPWTDDNGGEHPGFVVRAKRVNPDLMIVDAIKEK